MSRGFTLIELLVIVAIIGIFSTVALAMLGGARDKGRDATIKANLHTVKTQAEVYLYTATPNRYNTNGTSGVASSACSNLANTILANIVVWSAIQAAQRTNGGTLANVTRCAIANNGTSYAVAIQSKATPANWYCVDSAGSSNRVITYVTPALGGGAVAAVCPP
jgi:prepilin-type N-terminal cleavage/methylation domain-containing protein